nr:right-handed parallel beta-helix repeat-containing protein [Lachnospiraceae bacterium]
MKKPIFKSALALLLTAALVFTSATGSLASQTSVSENSVSENSVSDVIPAVSDNNIITSEDTTEYPTVTDTAETALTPDNESEYYSVSGTTYTVNAVNGTDITTALNAALSDASQVANAGNIYTVKVPAGSYTLSGTLHLYSNTTLSMYGATFTANASIAFTMLMLGTQSYVDSSECQGYDGFQNITVEGGTLVATGTHSHTPVRLTHATNLTLKGFTVGGGNADHLVEAVAIKNFIIDGCTFRNMSKSERGAREALQFDIAASDSIFPDIWQDGTMMENVTVKNCTFSNVSRGVGSHSMLLNRYHNNIKIINNTFNNVDMECIVALSYINSEISGNVMTNCGSGIILQSSKSRVDSIFTRIQNGQSSYAGTLVTNFNTKVYNNKIQVTYKQIADGLFGIKLRGYNHSSGTSKSANGDVIAANHYISGVEIYNNQITTPGYGISLQDARNNIVRNNAITVSGTKSSDKTSYNGILCSQGSSNNRLASNSVTNAKNNGILVMDDSSASEITGNTITKPGADGINIGAGCRVNGNIANNTVTNAGEHSITLYNKATVTGDITGNSISNSGMTGIQINVKSTVKGDVSKNTIATSGNNGISVMSSSAVNGDITENTVANSKKIGINIYEKSTVGGKISQNKVTNSTTNAIRVGKSSKAKKGITKNTINKAKKYGIFITEKSSVSKYVSDNKIYSAQYPIYVNKKSSANIGSNTYKKNKGGNYAVAKDNNAKIKSVKATSIKSAKSKSKAITLKWKKVKGATGYYVELSTTSDFKKISKKIDTKSLNGTFKKLKKGKTYYVRVSAYKKYGKVKFYSKTSKVKKVKVK